MVNSSVVASAPALPATSVAVTETSKVPSASVVMVSSATVQVVPLLETTTGSPLTVAEMAVTSASKVPLRAGLVSEVARVSTEMSGGVVSTVIESDVEALLTFPAASVAAAVRL